MDSLDRMYSHLVRTIRGQFPQYETEPFDVAKLSQTILPYRHNRRDLALETNEDYEITLSELLSGARDYLIVDERMRDTLASELASPNPDPSAFKQFADASVALSPAALRKLDAARPEQRQSAQLRPSLSAVAAPTELIATAPATPSPAPVIAPVFVPIKTTAPRAGEHCPACDQSLPAGREITFCPHCGQNLTTINCLACGSELELGWKFCPVCGRPASVHR